MASIISFSLYGNKRKYCQGAIENIKLAKIIYPGWAVRFYYDDTVPRDVVNNLRKLGADLIHKPTAIGSSGMFWRFTVADDPNYTRWIVRDADSRLSKREREAVDEWINSGFHFHLMRDHPQHQKMEIVGCSLGGMRDDAINFSVEIAKWKGNGLYGDDEKFLGEIIWPKIKHDILIHDGYSFEPRFGGGKIVPFPSERTCGFVGEPINL